jgi:hypothetical protein
VFWRHTGESRATGGRRKERTPTHRRGARRQSRGGWASQPSSACPFLHSLSQPRRSPARSVSESAAESGAVEAIGNERRQLSVIDVWASSAARQFPVSCPVVPSLSHAARTLTTMASRSALHLSNAARVRRPSLYEGAKAHLRARAGIIARLDAMVLPHAHATLQRSATRRNEARAVRGVVARGGHACSVAAVRQGGVSGARRTRFLLRASALAHSATSHHACNVYAQCHSKRRVPVHRCSALRALLLLLGLLLDKTTTYRLRV